MLSFIILSSDGYDDCWDPFFEQFEKNFPKEIDLEIILSTNEKNYSNNSLDIKVIKHGNNLAWSKRYLLCLEAAKYEVVLPLSEDFFLKSKMNYNAFKKVVQLISSREDIDHIRLLRKEVYKTTSSNIAMLDNITNDTKKRFIFSPGLWKKSVLKKYLLPHENPWIAEKMGDLRSKIYKHGFFCISKEYVEQNGQLYDTFFSGVVYKGKCAHYVVDFLTKEGYHKILERGIMSKEDMKAAKLKAKRNLIFSIIPIIHSYISVGRLYINEKIRST